MNIIQYVCQQCSQTTKMALGMRVINAATVARALEGIGYPALIATMGKALHEFSTNQVEQPVRSATNVDKCDGFFGAMPAYSPAAGLGIKLVSFFPENSKLDIPTHHAIIALFNPGTGVPETLMDGELITEWRTAAVSAVATKRLAAKLDKLAILGAGVQARSHALALASLSHWQEICIWNRNPGKAEALALALRQEDISADTIHHQTHLKDAVTNANVIVTATSASEPMLDASCLLPDVHINAVGACRPTWRELDDSIMTTAKVIVDSQAAAMQESGDVILSNCTIFDELGNLIAADTTALREQPTVFKSLGMAIEDVHAANAVQQWLTDNDMN
eukprot:TRINITY_DN6448_c0_g1_i1.p1 TRINITY_DN6448_c0_g1~~TRINITY_DN6448_c0_g1_i1.p1  ORF type:complete len:335 (+),score=67.25 TRINITY_DN6448_c0_g1_i1:2-1006(+)